MSTVRDIAKGAGWIMLFKVLSRILGLVSIAILARLLAPADFGLVALAMATIGALELLADFSFDVALIQKQDATPEHYDTVWTIALMFQSAIAILLVVTAYPLSLIFDEPSLLWALGALSIVPLLDGLQNIRVVDFRKQMLFHKDFAFMLTKRMTGFAITIPLAFYLQNYWALIIGTICGRLAGTIASYVLIPYKPRLGTEHWKEMIGFSKWLFFNNILFFLRHRATGFIIGKISGLPSVGLFEVANEISNLPATEFVAPINRATLPGISRVNNSPKDVSANYIQIVGLIMLVAVPAAVGISAVAEPLVYFALGDKWTAAIPVMTVLGVVGAINCAETNTGTTCLAIGRPDLVTKLYVLYVLILLTLTTLFTIKWGVIGAAYGWLAAATINIPIYYAVILRTLDVSFARFIEAIWRPIVACTLMFYGVRLYLAEMPAPTSSLDALPLLVAGSIVGATTYVAAVSILWVISGRRAGPETDIWLQVKSRLNRRKWQFQRRK